MAVIAFPARNKLAYPAGTRAGFDPTHPASNLNALSAVNLAGSFVNLSGGVGQQTGAISGTPVLGIQGIIGPNMNFQGVSDRILFAGMSTETQAAMTLAVIHMFTANTGGQNQFLVSCDGAASGGTLFGISSGTFVYGLNYGGGAILSTIPIVLNVPVFAAASVISNTSASFMVRRLDTGQVFAETVSAVGSIGTGGEQNWTISGRNGATGRQAIGYISAAMASYTALTPSQLRQWADDPWAFWYPPQARSLVATTAVTPPTTVLYSLMNVG